MCVSGDGRFLALTSYTCSGVRLRPVVCGITGAIGAPVSKSTGLPGLNLLQSVSVREDLRLSLVTVSGRGPTAIAK